MPNKTITVKNAAGTDTSINFLPDVGQQAKADSLPVVLASDQGALATTAAQLPSTVGQKVVTNSLSVVLASNSDPVPITQTADQDPIFDHTNGTKFSVTASATVLIPSAGCKYARISTDVDIFVNTAGIATVVDDGTAIRILANQPEVIPVVAGVAVKALSSTGTAIVRVTPLKVR